MKEFIFLYVAKLMELLKVYVSHYRRTATDQSDFVQYLGIIGSLNSMSQELWFFDSKPATFDMQYFNSISTYNRPKINGVFYYENPLERLKIMRVC